MARSLRLSVNSVETLPTQTAGSAPVRGYRPELDVVRFIAIEEQFYIVRPWAMRFVSRSGLLRRRDHAGRAPEFNHSRPGC